ncbi:MAG: DNA-binding protein [Bacteroidaceae bacterium]|jgi:hypothetical protein|nr:DNA-binding protein [Bacteroidaceae bacterium]MBQ9675041.1 DNA-binding protein [Bacteroidaceae bacterium]
MAKDLTVSKIERQNVLNNQVAIPRIQKALDIEAYHFEGKYYLTKQMVADFYEVDVRTIERYLESNKEELERNGYFLCKGKRLREFMLQFAPDINVGHKTVSLSLFDFRAFLNIGMLLAESEKAKRVRSLILDIVISTINEKAGGGTKYINWRDRDFLPAAIQEENYRKKLTGPINDYVEGHPTYKYAIITDMIYKAVFHENAKQYKELLKLEPKDNAKATMYAEVLRVISSFENGVGSAIRDLSLRLNRKISVQEVQELITSQAESPAMSPFLYDARQKMASLDLGLRDVYHDGIAGYLRALSPEEFERFIGSDSVDLEKLLDNDENKHVLERLKK